MNEFSLDLAPLRMLVALEAHGTLTQAAASLHLSQPAATHQLRQLEQVLGMALVEKRGRRLAFTAAGQAVLRRAHRMLREAAGIAHDMRALADLEAGSVRLGGGSTASIYLLPSLVARFRARHPGIAVSVLEASTPRILDAVAAGELDLGVVGLPSGREGVVVTPWLDDPIVFVGWPGAPLAAGPFPAAGLGEAPFIQAHMASPIGQTVAAGLQAHGITPSVVMTLESVEAIKAFVAAGMGYAAVSGRSVARELHEGRLVALAPEGLSLARQFGLASRPEASRSAAVAAFLEHMS